MVASGNCRPLQVREKFVSNRRNGRVVAALCAGMNRSMLESIVGFRNNCWSHTAVRLDFAAIIVRKSEARLGRA
jgi:hypothetical protein